jgi:hypothetical protein
MMDVTLLVFLLAPGFVTLGDAMLGIGLLLIATTFSCLGLLQQRKTSAAA